MIKYSIIVPHYNSLNSLKKLLLSIPNKRNVEVIIVDDKSKKTVIKEIKFFLLKLKNKNVKLYINETLEKGAGVARNIGISKCIGKWIIFADADDYFLDGFYEKIENIESNIKEEVDIIFFKVKSVNLLTQKESFRGAKITSLVENYLKSFNKNDEMKLKYCTQAPWGKIIRRNFIIKNNFKFDKTIVANDLIFSLKIGKKANKVMAINNFLYCVTKNENTLTTIHNFDYYKIRIYKFIEYYNMLSDEEKRIIALTPLPLIIGAKKYKVTEIIQVIKILKENNIKFFKYLKINKTKLKILYYILFK